jgi:hypothetical protein
VCAGDGLDTGQAQELLATYRQTLAVMRTHLADEERKGRQ